MKVVTKELFLDYVAFERAWRIKEIDALKKLASAPQNTIPKKDVICRSGTALLYAHWEGFVKNVGSRFLEHVSLQQLTLSELKPNFITLILSKKIFALQNSKRLSTFDEIISILDSDQNKKRHLPYKDLVNTKSNLNSDVLREIIWCLGLEYDPFKGSEKLIDTILLGRRNHIAHGNDTYVDKEDFIDLADHVIVLLDTFRNLAENSAINCSYKK